MRIAKLLAGAVLILAAAFYVVCPAHQSHLSSGDMSLAVGCVGGDDYKGDGDDKCLRDEAECDITPPGDPPWPPWYCPAGDCESGSFWDACTVAKPSHIRVEQGDKKWHFRDRDCPYTDGGGCIWTDDGEGGGSCDPDEKQEDYVWCGLPYEWAGAAC